jgi:predicted nucleotidyltransferase
MNKKGVLLNKIKEVAKKDKEVLFAYLYGSSVMKSPPFGSDVDVAFYLKPSDIKSYVRKEEELTFALVAKLDSDKVDLRILNALPFLLQYNIIKNGILLFARDESERVDFEIRVMNRFFELKPYLDEYDKMLSLRIVAGV